jgi:hypothetical protein
MKIEDLLSEAPLNIGQPMGAMKTLGNKIMGKLGSQRAQGKLQTGDIANQLADALKRYQGATDQPMTAKTIIAFLQQNGYPTQGAAQILNQYAKGNVPQGNAKPGVTAPAGFGNTPASDIHPVNREPDPNLGHNESIGDATTAEIPQEIINKALMKAAQDSAAAGGLPGGNQQGGASGSTAGGAPQGGQQAGGVEARLARLEKMMGVTESKKR